MKAYKYIIAAAGLLLNLSCSEFLEYRDKDKVIPQTLEQYSELVYGELIQKNMGNTLFTLEFMTDDFGSYVDPSAWSKTDDRLRYINYYTWAKEPQQHGETLDDMIDKIWEEMYHKVLMCNIIENDVQKIITKSNDEVALQQRLVAEVQCIRALSYYFLVNTYGDVYKDATQATTALGVPINNETSIKAIMYERSSLAAVYKKIEEDLDAAEANFKRAISKNTIFRPNLDIVLLLKSRIYLSMHRYDDAIAVCDQLIRSTSRTIAMAEFIKGNKQDNPFISNKNPGILFSWLKRELLYTGTKAGKYVNAKDLVESYDTKDLRSNSFFGTGDYKPYYKMDNRYKLTTSSGLLHQNFRIEEVYFNKAEAMLKSAPADYAKALDEVNKVRRERFEAGDNLLTATSADQAWTVFKAEKRREFCFEDIRWFDIRRWNERIVHLLHNLNASTEYTTYVLEAGSPNYVMSLPIDVLRVNDKITKPERIESKTIPNE